ncbi:MAG TPA: hypothetical protein VIG80_11460 [Bacillaceae bacterium]
MNIKEYYSNMSRLYLHQAVLFSIVFIAFVFPCMLKVPIFPVEFAAMSILICIVYYSLRYVYFTWKGQIAPVLYKKNGKVIRKYHPYVLIRSPHSRSLFHIYSADGICQYTILKLRGKKSQGEEFEMRTHLSSTTTMVQVNKNEVCITDNNQPVFLSVQKVSKAEKRCMVGTISYSYKRYNEEKLERDGKSVLSVKRGMMPVRLQQYFPPNSPLLEFDYDLDEKEKGLCICLYFIFSNN